jgi:hypothetical protein
MVRRTSDDRAALGGNVGTPVAAGLAWAQGGGNNKTENEGDCAIFGVST